MPDYLNMIESRNVIHSDGKCIKTEQVAERLLARIRNELMELGEDFSLDSDLFQAGMDSMAIMQVILIIEEEFDTQLPDSCIKTETFVTTRRIAEVVTAQQVT